MTLLDRLKDPRTEQDWQLAGCIPDYHRRLVLIKLKVLLGHLLHRPIWDLEPDTAARPESERMIHWPLAAQIAPVFQRALPAVHQELGWSASPPPDWASSRELCEILARGFRELFRTQLQNRPMHSWPRGLDPEAWLIRVRSSLDQHGAVEELIEHWDKHLRKWAPTLLIHGSCATLDHVPGTSDLDTVMVIAKETLCDPDQLQAFISEFHKNQLHLFRFNPYMHHGHMFVTELELGDLREASLPLCLAERGVTFGARPNFSLNPDSDLETLFTIGVFQDFFSKTIAGTSDIATSYDLLWWTSSSIFVPILYLQLKDGYSRWKAEALRAVREVLSPEENSLIDILTQIRLDGGRYFPPLSESNLRLLTAPGDLGRVIQLQKEQTGLTPEILAELKVNDRLILQAQAMYQRLTGESVRLFAERHLGDSPLKTCLLALTGKEVLEPPAPMKKSDYEAAKRWIVDLAGNSDDIAAVYQYGEVGCPGLSDLDILVVMRDAAANIKPFALEDMPGPLQDVMGHDATFVSESSLALFLKVFPLFEAKLLCGEGADRLGSSLQVTESILPLYSIALLAKYPSDLNFLCQSPRIRFKTILAFLHSFKHFLPMFDTLALTTPSAVLEAIGRDSRIRGGFAQGEIPSVLELPEIMEIMLRATAAVVVGLDQAWRDMVAAKPPAMASPLRLPSAGVEFCDGWSEESFLSSFSASILHPGSCLVRMPASLGWFALWLSQGIGPASYAMRRELNQSRLSIRPEENSFISSFKAFESFRQGLNAFADLEIKAGRSVSKYVTLVDIHPSQAAYFKPTANERLKHAQERNNAKFSLPPTVRKILVPRLDTFGDIVLLQGFLEVLLKRFPDAEITMLVREGYDELSQLFPDRLKWIATSLNPYQAIPGVQLQVVAGFLDLVSQDQWDIVFFTTYNRTWPEEILAAKLQDICTVALGEIKEPSDWVKEVLADLGLPEAPLFSTFVEVEKKNHESEKYQELWTALFPEDGKLPLPKLRVSDESVVQAEKVFDEIVGGVGGKYFVCTPAGTQNVSLKKWPADRFADVIAWACERYGFHPLLVGHRNELNETVSVAEILKEKGINPLVWLGKTGELPLLAALLSGAQFYLGNDTGTMHIAGAVGIPVVGVFGGGHGFRFLPVGPRSLGVAGELPCFGCGWDCLFGIAPCVGLVSTVDVQTAIERVLEKEPDNSNLQLSSSAVCKEVKDCIRNVQIKISGIERDAGQLRKELQMSEADRAARLEVIKRLENEFKEKLATCETDREARLQVILKQEREFREHLETLEADGEARLEVIHRLESMLIDHKAHAQELESRLADLESSVSWKITSPIRKLFSIFQKR